jgi:CRISPR-associated endonuclease Csy4
MDHYVDIDLRHDPEFSSHQLLAALFAKLHRALVAQASDAIGVSFPGFDSKTPHLGARLRLHGELAVLSSMLMTDWLAGMRDHVVLTQAALVPVNAKHRRVARVQVKSSPERMRRRLMLRQHIGEDEARQRIPDESARLTHLPYIQLRSASSGQTFRLFIEHGPIQTNSVAGAFNAYGLSQGATIPWF